MNASFSFLKDDVKYYAHVDGSGLTHRFMLVRVDGFMARLVGCDARGQECALAAGYTLVGTAAGPTSLIPPGQFIVLWMDDYELSYFNQPLLALEQQKRTAVKFRGNVAPFLPTAV